jgi:hypothetical protein
MLAFCPWRVASRCCARSEGADGPAADPIATPDNSIALTSVEGRRPVASYDLSGWERGEQAIPRAFEKFGAGVKSAARDIEALTTESLKSRAVLAQDVALGLGIALRQKYKDRTDYATFQQEHASDLAQIASRATAGLPDGPIKQHVEARLQKAAVAEQARGLENQTHAAYRREAPL